MRNCSCAWGFSSLVLPGVLLIVFCLLVFRCCLDPDAVLYNTDDNIGAMALAKSHLPDGFLGRYQPTPLLGSVSLTRPSLTNALLFLFPLRFFVNWIHAIYLACASLFLWLYLRRQGVHAVSAAIGVMAAYWVGTNLSLTYAGHTSKFGTLFFGSAALLCISEAVGTRRLAWSTLSGVALGGMFLEQQDLALFYGMFLGAYALVAVFRREGMCPLAWGRCLLPMVVLAMAMSAGTVFRVYSQSVVDVSGVTATQDAGDQWGFCTQWSVVPRESVEFIAPGCLGWRSHEPDGPYWGTTGQSTGWREHRSGFRNFRLEGIYLGSIPVFLALFAVFSLVGVRLPVGRRHNEILFWTSAVVISLLLSYGKYFPLYRVLYALPGMSSIRNPNKFLHVLQIGTGILAAYGLDMWLATSGQGGSPGRQMRRRMLLFCVALACIGLALISASALAGGLRGHLVGYLESAQWSAPASMVDLLCSSLLRGGLLSLITAAFICVPSVRAVRTPFLAVGLSAGLVAIAALDALSFSRYYIKALSFSSLIGRNAIVDRVRDVQTDGRLYLLQQAGFFNQWMTFVFPYYQTPVFNFTQMPRMPEEYRQFLARGQRDPIRMWQLAAVRYVLAPTATWRSLEQHAVLRGVLEPEFGFSSPLPGSASSVSVMQPGEVAPFLFLKNHAGGDWCRFVGAWRAVELGQGLDVAFSREFDPLREVAVSGDTSTKLPASPPASGAIGSVDYVGGGARSASFAVDAREPGIVVLSQRNQPGWVVTVDGRVSDILRCNGLCMGVYVPAGKHDVVFFYAPSTAGLWLQMFAILLGLCAATCLAFFRQGSNGASKERAAA